MDSKSGILIDNKLDKRSQNSDVQEKELQTDSVMVQTASSDISTLTQTLEYEEEVLDSGCRTPTEFIFDPFAPGPEELANAPKRKNRTLLYPRRQLSLSFDLTFPIEEFEREFEEMMEKKEIEDLCKSFLDLIISDVLEICEGKLSSEEEEEEEGFKTPTKMPLLTGFADTCPGAPVRPGLKQKSFTKADLCRKLDFEFDLD